MDIIIEHSHTKRFIVGPFNICGTGKTLRYIAETILTALDRDEQDMPYGWITITDPVPTQASIANTEPVPWDR